MPINRKKMRVDLFRYDTWTANVSRTDILSLLDELDELESALEKANKEIEAWRAYERNLGF